MSARDERQAGGLFTHKVGEDDGVPDAHANQHSAPEHVAQLGDEFMVEGERRQLVRACCKDERARPEVETAVLFDEIAARKKPVGQLLHGALRRTHGSCQLGQSDAALAQRHDLEDLYDSVDCAMGAGRHAADGSKPYPPSDRTCTEARVTVLSRQ
jgi:hypothetical protein